MRLLCLRKHPFSSFSRLTKEVSEMTGGLLSRYLAVLSMADAHMRKLRNRRVKFYRGDLASERVLYVYPGLASERGSLLKKQGLVAGSVGNQRRMADQYHRNTWKGAQNPLETLSPREVGRVSPVSLLRPRE